MLEGAGSFEKCTGGLENVSDSVPGDVCWMISKVLRCSSAAGGLIFVSRRAVSITAAEPSQ